jgi:hypothetical protein
VSLSASSSSRSRRYLSCFRSTDFVAAFAFIVRARLRCRDKNQRWQPYREHSSEDPAFDLVFPRQNFCSCVRFHVAFLSRCLENLYLALRRRWHRRS